VERGSDKHGPRLDDQMEHDVRPLLQGAPVEARATEAREQEGPGEDDVRRKVARQASCVATNWRMALSSIPSLAA
jgi:hypothetical protein